MAKTNRNFNTEKKKSSRSFDLEKDRKSTRKFDLSKDDHVPAPIIDTENVNPATVDPIIDPQPDTPIYGGGNEESSSKKKKTGLWIAIGVIVAFLCILFLWILPSRDKNTNGRDTDPATPIQIEEGVEAPEAIEAEENSENTETSAAQDSPAGPATADPVKVADHAERTENVVTETTPVAPEIQHTPVPAKANESADQSSVTTGHTHRNHSAVSDDIDAEAKKVIRGKYGNNPRRKKHLGDKYDEIQRRVNELKRSKKF